MSKLYEQLTQYSRQDYYPYHMPGHKRRMQGRPLESLYGIDITEIDGFDNLHHAEGILKEVQDRAAGLWGARKSYFLVNGSTCGLLSAVACAAGGEKVFVMARNCHKAAYHGIYLNRARVHYIYPEQEGFPFAGVIAPEAVRQALAECHQAGEQVAAVLITSPTYEGQVSNIREIAHICHQEGTMLIVDEAHGAHLGFAQGYPDTAVHQGADLVIQSVHKTLPAMTQTALLHVCSERVDLHRLERFLGIYQTSSPSYIMMSSIDLCMDIIEQEAVQSLADRMENLKWFQLETANLQKIHIFYPSDPLKMVLSVDGCKMTGKQFYDMLLKEYHLQMEMAAGNYVLAMFSMMDETQGYRRLASALQEIDKKLSEKSAETDAGILKAKEEGVEPRTGHPQAVLPIFEAYEAGSGLVDLEKGAGCVAAEFVSLYPPGIPLLVPGEQIREDTVAQIRTSLEQGLTVLGIYWEGEKQKLSVLQP